MMKLYSVSRLMFVIFFLKLVIAETLNLVSNNGTHYELADGGKVKIHCKALAVLNETVSWEVNGKTLNGSMFSENSTNSQFNVTSNASLIISNPRMSTASGLYNISCSTNTSGSVQRLTYQVAFLKAPRILTKRSKNEIFEDTEVWTIDCETTGYPKPSIEWKFGGNVLNASHNKLDGELIHKVLGEPVFYRLLVNGTLWINHPQSHSHVPYRNFTCVARNIAGEDKRTHDLLISTLTRFTFEVVLPKENFTNQGKDVRQKIQDVFQSNKSYHSVNVTSVNVKSQTVYFELTWTEEVMVKYVLSADVTNVVAIAKDVVTTLRRASITELKFIMNGRPGPPTDLAVVDTTTNEITFSWRHPKYFRVDNYQVQIKDTNGWKNIKLVKGNKTSVTLDGLDSDTKYLIRMHGSTGDHTGKIYSENLQAETEGKPPVTVIVAVVVIVVLVILTIIVAVIYFRQKPKGNLVEENPYVTALPGVSVNNIYIHGNRTFCPLGDGLSEDEYFSWTEIPRGSLIITGPLGQGEFGMVEKALWEDDQTGRDIPVAVKKIKDNATEVERKELLKELRLMADVAKHPNIVNLVGACSRDGPLWVIIEFCEHGNLKSFLKENRREMPGNENDFVTSVDPLVRVRIAYDVSKGMSYLEEKKIVHRDLAARNVLLGKNKIAKISDFGLSRDIYEIGLYQKNTGGKLPVKWMAIESLQEATYTSKSDVWSFGILLWEIETAGVVPYPGISGRDLLALLQNGVRPSQPTETPSEIYELMQACWQASPKERPPFTEIESKLNTYLEERADYLPVIVDEGVPDIEGSYVNYYIQADEEEATTTSSV